MQELTLNNHERIDALTAASELAAKTTTLTVNTAKTSTPADRGKKLATLVKNRPLKSSLGVGHPASILNDTRKKVYFGNEDDTADNKGVYHVKMYRWLTDDDGIEPETSDSCTTLVHYRVLASKSARCIDHGLIDRGANGGVDGNDVVWIGAPTPARHVSITGIDNHQIPKVPIGTVGAYVMSNRGPVICIFHETTYTGNNKSILSSTQLEHYNNRVDD